MGQHHDSALSLNYTVISVDSPHMRKDGANYLKFLLRAPHHWIFLMFGAQTRFRLERSSCVVLAGRDMLTQFRLTGYRSPCNVRPTRCNRVLPTRAFGHPTRWTVRVISPRRDWVVHIHPGSAEVPSSFRPLAN